MDTATKIRHLQATATFVHDRMSTNEGSHDLRHVYRVQHLAQRFAAELQLSGVDVDVFIVRMAALLHDVFDSKLYTPSEENDHKTGEELLTRFLAVDRGLQAGNVQHIVRIAEGISYSKQLKCPMDESLRSIEMNIVEDADRIESIGAIGVARCIAYSGSLMNSLEESRLHFDDKVRFDHSCSVWLCNPCYLQCVRNSY